MRVSFATKISIAIVGVLVLALLSSIVAIGTAYQFETHQKTLIVDNLQSVRAAEELEIALLEQRGYVASYILDDGNEEWLQQLDQHRQDFDDWLERARAITRTDEQRKLLDQLKRLQQAYADKRKEVVDLYVAGQEAEARQTLLSDVSELYRNAYDVCELFIAQNIALADDAGNRVRKQVGQMIVVATTTLVMTTCLGLGLLWLFFQGVIFPLRRMAREVRGLAGKKHQEAADGHDDDLREFGHYLRILITDAAETRSDLEQSRTQLAHADKLAAVGKLAASVAHEIRNPLTSIKMWLYSLRRSAGQDVDMLQKFAIVSDEIARLESIVRNFLEFSRPPKLQLKSQSIDVLIDKTVELVQHRLEDQQVTVARADEQGLPPVVVDTEQMRQVLLNLIQNAIEAMPGGGEIRISAGRSLHGGREMVAVRVGDTGTGIPSDVQQRIFEPFFTTKEEGTGLGLCIAASVMARHQGLLELESSDAQGTRWTIWIPTGESATAAS